jgi:phosphatidylglycerol---prolipoprotein diacylglyceryl transferase
MLPYVFLGSWIHPSLSWLKIGSYGVMMAIGFLTASWLLARDLKRRNLSPAIADTVILLGIVGGVLGSKLAYMLTEADRFEWGDLFSGSGLTWHGGLILAAALIIGFFFWKRLSLPVMLDVVAPELASGYAFGRLGCQVSGDGCYGLPCTPEALDRVLCISYPNGIIPTHEAVHPTPLYEAAANFALFGVLWALRGRIRNPGVLFGIYLTVSGLSRFAVEFIRRADGRADRFWGLRDAHLIALGQVLLGLGMMLWWGLRKAPGLPDYGVMPAAPAPAPAAERKRRGRKGR